MNDGQLSSMTKAMIEAAKADVPGAAARAKVWAQVSSAVGAAAAGSGAAAGGAAAAGGTGAKLLVVGALFGGTLTVGLAATVLRVGQIPFFEQHSQGRAAAAMIDRVAPAVVPAEIAPMGMAGAPAGAPAIVPGAGPVAATEPPTVQLSALLPVADEASGAAHASPAARPAPAPAPPAHVSAPARATAPAAARPATAVDPLAREAQLVSEARGALGRGDARGALQAVRAARALPSHQLTPEELAVESQALRALGRPVEANEADVTLRSQFPESALAH